MELVKREDHYGLYNEDGHKIAATLDGCNSKLSKENCDEIFGLCEQEVWYDIPNFAGYYQVSNYGNVKSLSRVVLNKGIHPFKSKEKLLKPTKDGWGYLSVKLRKENKNFNIKCHQLVAIAFLGHKINGVKIVVDHVDNNKLNNHVSNLQLVSNRVNTSKDRKSLSKYIGVSFRKKENKWTANIRLDGKNKNLGFYNNEEDAAIAYQKEFSKLEKQYFNFEIEVEIVMESTRPIHAMTDKGIKTFTQREKLDENGCLILKRNKLWG
jgi:hypothetical protein